MRNKEREKTRRCGREEEEEEIIEKVREMDMRLTLTCEKSLRDTPVVWPKEYKILLFKNYYTSWSANLYKDLNNKITKDD